MPSKPPFYKQETPDSCVPACLRMVFGSFGIDIEESSLRDLCDCGIFGTDALRAIDTARQLGFAGSSKHTLTLGEMQTLVAEGNHPIVFVDLRPISGVRNIHAVVVTRISAADIIVLDPLKGERSLAVQAFSTAWAMAHNMAIIIKR